MYKHTQDIGTIQRVSDGAFIPTNPENADYAAVLAWVSAGNTIAPADSVSVVPDVVTMRQAQRALLAAGLLDQVNAAIAQSPREAQIDWERAQDVERSNPLVASLAAVLGLDDAALDGLFITAAQL